MYSTVWKKKTTDVMYSLEKYFLLKNKKQKQERQQMAMAPIYNTFFIGPLKIQLIGPCTLKQLWLYLAL